MPSPKKKRRVLKKSSPKKIAKKRTFLRSGGFHVYMLECSDGSFYTGYTNDLEKRIALHNKGGGSKYVKTRLPARLVYCKPYKYYKLAILEERRMKTLTRSQKEKIVASFIVAEAVGGEGRQVRGKSRHRYLNRKKAASL